MGSMRPPADRRSGRGRAARRPRRRRRARAQRALAAAVAHLLVGELVDREHEVDDAVRRETGARRPAHRRSPDACAARPPDGQHRGAGRRSGSGSSNGAARASAPRVAAAGLRRRRRRTRTGGCGAPPRSPRAGARRCRRGTAARTPGVGERDVEQRLVALALDELGRDCARPRSARRCRAAAPGPRGRHELRQAGMMRAGLVPTLGHVGERIRRRRRPAPRAARRSCGAPARRASARRPATASRRNGSVPARNSSAPRRSSASWRYPGPS